MRWNHTGSPRQLVEKVMRRSRLAVLATLLLLTVALPVGAGSGTVINFSSLDKSQDHAVKGTLYLPDSGSPPYPAVVMVHGTAGINETGALYRDPAAMDQKGYTEWNADAANDSLTKVIEFLRKNLVAK